MLEKELLLSITSLNKIEIILLNRLIFSNGKVVKGKVECLFKSKEELEMAVNGLLKKSFIYLRKNRLDLTDREDRIYLLKEIGENISRIKKYDICELKRYIDVIMATNSVFCKSIPYDLKKIISIGGFAFISDKCDEYNELYKRGFLDIAILYDDKNVIPVWIIKKNMSYFEDTNINQIQFIQSIYLNDIVNILDCLLYSSLEKSKINYSIGAYLKTVKNIIDKKEKYLKELFDLGLLKEENGKYVTDRNFIERDFDYKVSFLKGKLSKEEKEVLDFVKKVKKCSKIYAISHFIREQTLSKLFNNDFQKIDVDIILKDFLEKIDRMIFRGLLIEDNSGEYISFNSFQKKVVKNNSVLVNSNGEIIVYSKSISLYSLFVIAGFSHIMHYGDIIRLKINRESVIKGIRYIGNINIFIKILKISSDEIISSNIITSINEWAKSFLEIEVEKKWIIKVDSEVQRLRIYENSYIRSVIEEGSDNYLIIQDLDLSRFKKAARKDNIFLNIKT